MLPLLIILIITGLMCLPLCITYAGRTIVGQKRIKFISKQLTKKKQGKFIWSVYLPVIVSNKQPLYDGVVVAKSGIYVVKIMNVRGKLSGSKDQNQWTLYNKKTKTSEVYDNPLINDKARIEEIGKLLGISNNIYSCVVYIQGNIKSVDAPIYTIRKFYSFLKANKKQQVLSKEDIDKYSKIIQDYRDKQINDYVANNKCIKCGQTLNLTNNTKKYIINCSNPKCKFKYKIKK